MTGAIPADSIGWAVITALILVAEALWWAVIRLREASPMPPRASPSLRTPRKPPDRMRFGRRVISLILIVMCGSATAVKVTEHSCYTGLDPETATSMNCYFKGLTGAYYLRLFISVLVNTRNIHVYVRKLGVIIYGRTQAAEF